MTYCYLMLNLEVVCDSDSFFDVIIQVYNDNGSSFVSVSHDDIFPFR